MKVLNDELDSGCAQNSRDLPREFWLNPSALGGAGAQNYPNTSTTASAF